MIFSVVLKEDKTQQDSFHQQKKNKKKPFGERRQLTNDNDDVLYLSLTVDETT